VLFLTLFAAQSGVLVLSPLLTGIAKEFEVSTATAGQLRTVSGLTAAVVALAVPLVGGRARLRSFLLAGLGVLAAANLASAAAPSIWALGAAQVAMGVAVGVLVSAGTTAAAEWASDDGRARLLSAALMGQASAWVIGMPIVGVVADVDWRYGWLAVPLTVSLAALVLAWAGPDSPVPTAAGGIRRVLRDRNVAGWALGELLANSAWAGTLVYAGALVAESYDASTATVGLVLALGGAAYLPGNFLIRRWTDAYARTLLILLGLAAATTVVVFGGVRTGVWESAAIFAVLGFLGGGRTLAGTALGAALARENRLAAMGVRTATLQFGYLLGAALGGLALAAGGYPALGVLLGTLFVAGVLPHVVATMRPAPTAAPLTSRVE